MLLSVLRGIFEDYIMNGLADCAHLNITKVKIPTTRWIITKLHSYFGELVMFNVNTAIVYHKNVIKRKRYLAYLVSPKKVCGKEKEVLPTGIYGQ